MTARPLVVITDVTDLDPAPAVELLTAHGYDVEILALYGFDATNPAS